MLRYNRFGFVRGMPDEFGTALRARRAELSENERDGWESLLEQGEPLPLLLRPEDLTLEEF